MKRVSRALVACSLAWAIACGPESNPPIAPPEAVPKMAAVPASSEPFDYQTPQSWNKIKPTEQRNPNFAIPGADGAPPAECYVTQLAGDGGGLAANVNRWRGQMELAALGDPEIAALPKLTVMGGQATLVDLKGSIKGMASSTAATPAAASEKSGQDELLGCIVSTGGGTVFVKMTGPAATVSAQADNFKVFLGSLKPQAGAMASAPIMAGASVPTGSATRAGADRSVPGIPNDAAHAGLLPGAAPAAMSASPAASTRYTWTAPAGWKDAGPDSMNMRAANYRAGAHDEVECYVSIAGGGVEPNINRWRGQMGQPEFTPEELAKLPKIKILGKDSPLVAIEGTFTGMSGPAIPNAELLGAVCPIGDQQMFIKMTGPKAAVEAERQRFIDFCQSTKEGK